MTADTLPWEDIQIPAKELKLLRVSAEHPHNFFWGRDASGHYLLVLKFEEKDFEEELAGRKISVIGH